MRSTAIFVTIIFITTCLFSCKTLDETLSPIIKLSSNVPTNAQANGRSSYRFIATVSTLTSEEYNTVTFKCSAGRFAGSDSITTQQVRVNEKGEAVSDWIVPNKGGSYFISASIGSGNNIYEDRVTVSLIDTITAVAPVDTIFISIPGADTVRADGQTTLRVNLALNNPLQKQLIVSNNVGILSNGTTVSTATTPLTVQLDPSGKEVLFLKMATNVEPYFVRANIAGDAKVFKLFSFTPKRAYPDKIILEADSSLVEPNSQTPVNIFLVRNVGQVSNRTPIDFEAYQDVDGVKQILPLLKNISNNFSDDQGKASVVFVADPTIVNNSKPVYIRASSRNDKGETIIGEIKIQVKIR